MGLALAEALGQPLDPDHPSGQLGAGHRLGAGARARAARPGRVAPSPSARGRHVLHRPRDRGAGQPTGRGAGDASPGSPTSCRSSSTSTPSSRHRSSGSPPGWRGSRTTRTVTLGGRRALAGDRRLDAPERPQNRPSDTLMAEDSPVTASCQRRPLAEEPSDDRRPSASRCASWSTRPTSRPGPSDRRWRPRCSRPTPRTAPTPRPPSCCAGRDFVVEPLIEGADHRRGRSPTSSVLVLPHAQRPPSSRRPPVSARPATTTSELAAIRSFVESRRRARDPRRVRAGQVRLQPRRRSLPASASPSSTRPSRTTTATTRRRAGSRPR